MPKAKQEESCPTITERTIEEALRLLSWNEGLSEAIAAALEVEEESVTPFSVSASTFREAGVLTYNAGVVLRFSTGAEFQLTILRSAR